MQKLQYVAKIVWALGFLSLAKDIFSARLTNHRTLVIMPHTVGINFLGLVMGIGLLFKGSPPQKPQPLERHEPHGPDIERTLESYIESARVP